ncbi:MAG: flagellar biosynthesis protein FlhF [Proteobacteria bacterium]|nr:flagellar biosynthesis protein FlhF [Pseudomonadota bacterium]
MKIKRFVDTDMRHVLRRVREEQGADAVILSNRRVEGGIEVIAAVDYDEALIQQALGSQPAASPAAAESAVIKKSVRKRGVPSGLRKSSDDSVRVVSADLRARKSVQTDEAQEPEAHADASKAINEQKLALNSMRSEMTSMRGMLETQLSSLVWRDKARNSPMRAQILRNLTKIGIGPDIANIIANRLKPIQNARDLWRAPLLTLAKTIPLIDDNLLRDGGVAALVGPTGVGKTTTIAKMASRYAMQFGANEIALISADAHRVGAQEHLATFAKILGVEVYQAEDVMALERLLDQLKDKKLVLIDTEGTSQRDTNLTARLAAYGNNEDRVHFYLTLAATCQEAGLNETIRVFNRLPLTGAVITKIDEAAQLGCVLSALIRHDLPAAFLTDGQRVPDDFYLAGKKRLWLMNQALECMRSSEFKVDEEMMIEKFGKVGTTHA